MTLPEHLGGHLNKTHIDEGSLNFFINSFNIKSFLDIGCGPGGMVELAHSKGLEALGIDGDYTLSRFNPNNFLIHDYSTGPLVLNKTYDLCWSCEFVEHVEEEFLDNFMATFNSCNLVAMTYAPPGTPGHHHVNCKNMNYWVDVFNRYNFTFDDQTSNIIKKVSTMKKPFMQKNGLFFKKAHDKYSIIR